MADYWLYPRFVRPSGIVVNRNRNGIWLRYTWYFGEHTGQALQSLAARLESHGIRDAFFHVRSIKPDGTLTYRYPGPAKELNQSLAKVAPNIRRVAWIFVDRSSVRVQDPLVRKKMVREAVWLVRACGFQGVQWDYEICPSDDPDFITLLKETKQALPKNAYLGAAVPTWYPAPFASQGWSPDYYSEVARYCDGIAVMAYDSATYFPRAYVDWVASQVEVVTKAAARTNPACQILIGVPTYKNSTPSHNPRTENLRLALIGVRQGLPHADLRTWQGVAVFADYTTNNDDWNTLSTLWP